MSIVTIPFAEFLVGPTPVRSAAQVLPPTLTQAVLQLLDPNGDWVAPANAGSTCVYGLEFSIDGGVTWATLVGNGVGQPVGSLSRQGSLPQVSIRRDSGIIEAYGMPVRAFASCSPGSISIAAQALITT